MFFQLVLIFAPIEIFFGKLFPLKGYRKKEIILSINFIILTFFLNTYFDPMRDSIFAQAHSLRSLALSPELSKNIVLIFLFSEFFYYWSHRLLHSSNLLWTFGHCMHHSIRRINIINGSRVGLISIFGNFTLVIICLILAGFDPEYSVIVFGTAFSVQGITMHLAFKKRMKYIELILFTPRTHSLHHAKNSNCNFGGYLNIFDRLFGTFENDLKDRRCGLKNQLRTINPLKAASAELLILLKNTQMKSGYFCKLKYIFWH